MNNIEALMNEINEVSQVAFKVRDESGDIYTSANFCIKDIYVEKKFKVHDKELVLMVCKEDENVIPLLSNYVENRIKLESDKRSSIIKDIIEGRRKNKSEVEEVFQFLNKGFNLLLIYVEDKLEQALDIIQEGYSDEEIITMIYKERIILLGNLEDIYDHALSIKETVEFNLNTKCLISYSAVDGYKSLSKCLNICNKKISLAIRFNIGKEILWEGDFIFEDIVDNISEDKKKTLVEEYNKGFNKLDKEMIKTIEVFFNCGLNISDGSKKLFIHRNTLIYRLDKIEKYTGFDIRNFNMAALFKIIFFLWKDTNKSKLS